MADMENQPHQDVQGAAAIKLIKELAEKANICMFHTRLTSVPGEVSPMSLQEADDAGTLWFISSTESERNKNITADNRVQLTFHNNAAYEFLALNGTAAIHKDRALIDKYWTKLADAWFDGKDDPRVTVISVTPQSGHYWDTKNGKIVAGIKMLFAAVTGSGANDGGVDGNIKL